MAALAFPEIAQIRHYIRLDTGIAGLETDHALLLDALREQTGSQVAVLYEFQPDTAEVNALAARSTLDARVKDVGVTLSGAATQWIDALAAPAQGRPAGEPNFEKFPEVLQYQLKRLAVIPLRTENQLFGLLTLGRVEDTPFQASQLDLANRAGRLLTALLERDSLQQKLLERKLVERAKGILQQRRRLSEEQAYLLLRNNSRRRRMPMANLAKEVIDTYIQTDTRRWQPV